MIPIPSFDQVYVISDLHMGGPPGHQIFGQPELLTKFIDHLRTDAEGDCALVINGDMVDFLAQPSASAFDPKSAIDQWDNIARSFPGVWTALRAYVATSQRHLAIVLGNHDLELAMPWVREHVLNDLSAGSAEARQRIALYFDGTGFACTVGGRQLLCLHGNEVDDWNVTDFAQLRRIGVDMIQGRPFEPWTPNAGSKLVVDLMNSIKRDHAFIDLLKPEKEAALRIMVAMRPELEIKAKDVVGILKRRFITTPLRRAFNLLGDETISTPATDEESTRALASIMGGVDTIDATALMDRVEDDFQQGCDPVDLVYRRGAGQLGLRSAVAAAITGRAPHRVAWESVKELVGDRTFVIDRPDSDFEMIDALAGPNFDVVVAGHTHLARVQKRGNVGGGRYFNTGTWAWLMRLRPDQLETAETFKPVFERLSAARTIDELSSDLKFARPTVAILKKNADPDLKTVAVRKGSIDFVKPEEGE